MGNDGTYREHRSSLVAGTVWTRTADGSAGWVLPDGCLDVLWDGELLVAGPDTGPYRSQAAAGTPFAALRFDPGVGPAVLGLAADGVRNERVPLSEVLADDVVAPLADRLAAAPPGDRTRLLERWAADRLAGGPAPDPAMLHVAELLDAGRPVAEVADAVGLGTRQLHRRALAAFGYGPKVLARVLRLQRALALARDGTGFARTAAESGFADQAHLAREVRALAGRPLGQLVSAANRSTPVPSGSRRLA